MCLARFKVGIYGIYALYYFGIAKINDNVNIYILYVETYTTNMLKREVTMDILSLQAMIPEENILVDVTINSLISWHCTGQS